MEGKLGEQAEEKVRPELCEEAVRTMQWGKGVPKWMEKPGTALVQLFNNPEGLETLKLIKCLSNDMWCTMLHAKESYATKYHHKSKKRRGNGDRACQSQGLRPRMKQNMSLDRMLDRADRNTTKMAKAG